LYSKFFSINEFIKRIKELIHLGGLKELRGWWNKVIWVFLVFNCHKYFRAFEERVR
jgi:hypothetical protein